MLKFLEILLFSTNVLRQMFASCVKVLDLCFNPSSLDQTSSQLDLRGVQSLSFRLLLSFSLRFVPVLHSPTVQSPSSHHSTPSSSPTPFSPSPLLCWALPFPLFSPWPSTSLPLFSPPPPPPPPAARFSPPRSRFKPSQQANDFPTIKNQDAITVEFP